MRVPAELKYGDTVHLEGYEPLSAIVREYLRVFESGCSNADSRDGKKPEECPECLEAFVIAMAELAKKRLSFRGDVSAMFTKNSGPVEEEK